MHNEKFNYIKFWCDLNMIIIIECILLKFHWGMKALMELHFQHEALQRFIEYVQRFHTSMKLQKNAFNS